MSRLKKFLHSLLDLFFPPRCQVCRRVDVDPLCRSCITKISFIRSDYCVICGRPGSCNPCYNKDFDMVRSVMVYEGVVRKALQKLKFKGKIKVGAVLAGLMVDHVEKHFPEIQFGRMDLVVSVPISKNKLKERGFNQADFFAQAVARKLDIQFANDLLIRAKDTQALFNLGRMERKENISGAFTVDNRYNLKGKRILLIDDIFTTGSTARECVKVIKRLGAAHVAVLTLSRAIYH